MARRTLIVAIFLAAAVLFSNGGARVARGVTYNVIVDDTFVDACDHKGPPDYQSITAAVADATDGEVIRVCGGTYVSDTINLSKNNVTLLGPAVTPENDGIAIVKMSNSVPSTQYLINVTGYQDMIEGFDFDLSKPPSFTDDVYVYINGHFDHFSDNIVRNSTGKSISVDGVHGMIERNHVTASAQGIVCNCTSGGYFSSNVVDPTGDHTGISVTGGGTQVVSNVLAQDTMSVLSDQGLVETNQVTGPGATSVAVTIAGGDTLVQDNIITNPGGTDLKVTDSTLVVAGTLTYITKNTFGESNVGIGLQDDYPADARPVTATIGGTLANANTFMNNAFLDLILVGVTADINAEYNNWGFCTLAEIETAIFHHPDEPSDGTVDYDPFVDPGNCPTPTPLATPSPTPSPTLTAGPSHSPSPSPTVTPSGSKKWGDINCNGSVHADDALALVDSAAGLPANPPHGCPDPGANVVITATLKWGDVNCDGHVDVNDALVILASLGGVPFTPASGCPHVGDVVRVETS